MMMEEVRTRLIGECLLPAPPKVTPQHAAAVRLRVIYTSFRGRVGVQMLPWLEGSGPRAAAAVMEIPLTARLLPRERSSCHQGAAQAPRVRLIAAL